MTAAPERPYLSIIVPVKNGQTVLPIMLGNLVRSELPRESWELIVVDDGSADDSPAIASEYADLVIRLPGRSRGPGYARNRGVERARGECIVFLDADVVVRPDTLSRIAAMMSSRPDVDAVFGAYCDEPAAAGVVSQYRNLLHHYTHDQEPGEAQTFWAGCGCVRRSVFLAVGMYDEWRFSRPQIEDVELGYRMSAHGYHILLQPEIQVTHLKRWTFRGMLKADFMDRGVPWARLLAEQRALLGPAALKAKTLSLRAKEKSNTLFVCLGLLLLALSVGPKNHLLATLGALCLVIVIIRGTPLYSFFRRKRGLVFAICGVVLHMIYYLTAAVSVAWGAFLALLVGEPKPDPSVEAFSELNLAAWPPVPRDPSKWVKPTVTKTNAAEQ
jgi:GT2 family glycosyltransferase